MDLSASFAFDILYYSINNPRSYCIKLEESIQTESYAAEAIFSLSTASAEQILVKIGGSHNDGTFLSVWSYDEQHIQDFLTTMGKRYNLNLLDLKKIQDGVRLQDLQSGITILKELDRVYYYSMSGETYRRIYFMLADSRERLYKIMIKGLYGTFNPALIEMQTYLGLLLRKDQDSPIQEQDSFKVGFATLKWKRYLLVLLQQILTPEE